MRYSPDPPSPGWSQWRRSKKHRQCGERCAEVQGRHKGVITRSFDFTFYIIYCTVIAVILFLGVVKSMLSCHWGREAVRPDPFKGPDLGGGDDPKVDRTMCWLCLLRWICLGPSKIRSDLLTTTFRITVSLIATIKFFMGFHEWSFWWIWICSNFIVHMFTISLCYALLIFPQQRIHVFMCFLQKKSQLQKSFSLAASWHPFWSGGGRSLPAGKTCSW